MTCPIMSDHVRTCPPIGGHVRQLQINRDNQKCLYQTTFLLLSYHFPNKSKSGNYHKNTSKKHSLNISRSNGLELCVQSADFTPASRAHSRHHGLCAHQVCTHSSKPFEREMFPQRAASTRSSGRSILPQMDVSLPRQDKSQPASYDHPDHSCLSRGHCSHIYARYR